MKELAEREYEGEEYVPCIQKGNMDEAKRILPPEMKHDLLDCLRKKSMLSPGFEPRSSLFDWFSKSFELIFGGSDIHMKHMIRLSQPSPPPQPAAAPAPAPSLSLKSPESSPISSPSDAPMSSPSNAPAKSPPPKRQSPVKAHAPPLAPPSDDADTDTDADTDVSDSPSPPPPVVRSPPLSRAHPKSHPSKKHEEDQTAIIVGIVAAGVGVILAVALLLFCCRRGEKSKVDPKDGLKDERPLLNISLSELSAGTIFCYVFSFFHS